MAIDRPGASLIVWDMHAYAPEHQGEGWAQRIDARYAARWVERTMAEGTSPDVAEVHAPPRTLHPHSWCHRYLPGRPGAGSCICVTSLSAEDFIVGAKSYRNLFCARSSGIANCRSRSRPTMLKNSVVIGTPKSTRTYLRPSYRAGVATTLPCGLHSITGIPRHGCLASQKFRSWSGPVQLRVGH